MPNKTKKRKRVTKRQAKQPNDIWDVMENKLKKKKGKPTASSAVRDILL